MVLDFETREMQGHEVCTVREAARVLGVTPVTVGKYMNKEILEFIILPSKLRQPLADSVRTFLNLNQK